MRIGGASPIPKFKVHIFLADATLLCDLAFFPFAKILDPPLGGWSGRRGGEALKGVIRSSKLYKIVYSLTTVFGILIISNYRRSVIII